MNDRDAVLARIDELFSCNDYEQRALLRFAMRGVKEAMKSIFGTEIDDAFALHILRNKIVDESFMNMVTTGIETNGIKC